MNYTDIAKMTDEELNVLAAKVIYNLEFKKNPRMITKWEVNGSAYELPNSTYDIKEAFKLIEAIKNKFYSIRVEWIENRWVISFWKDDISLFLTVEGSELAKTITIATTMAILK